MIVVSAWIWSLYSRPSPMDARSREELTAAIKDITKLENPNSVHADEAVDSLPMV